jgi:prepilin-type N-terminal cleavage/methylation domain-containing protein
MKTTFPTTRSSANGFTLVEMLISVAVFTIVTVGVLNVFRQTVYSFNETSLMRTAGVRASLGLDRMVMGVGTNAGLREADAASVAVTYTNTADWQLSFTNQDGTVSQYFKYTAANKFIVDQSGKTICTNLISATATNLTNGCQISVSVAESCGGRTLTNTMTTFVQYRN